MTDHSDFIEELIKSYGKWDFNEVEHYPRLASNVINDLLVRLRKEHERANENLTRLVDTANLLFAAEVELSQARGCIQESYNAFHMRTRRDAIDILFNYLNEGKNDE